MNSRAKLVVVMTSIIVVALVLLGGGLGKSASPEGPYRHLSVYTDVLSRIKSEYVEEPDMKSVTLGALNGLLESIDPFASYLNADQYREYSKNKDAHKGDVGLILSKKFGYIGVVAAMPGSPAAKAGLTTGDMIETIKGIATRDMPLAYAELLLRGDPGSTLDISVLRVRHPEPQKLKLTRGVIAYPAVISKMLSNQVGYVRPETLGPHKLKEISSAINGLQKQGAGKMILDLRNCAVGNPEEGIALANLFLDKGLITYVQGQRVPRQNFEADASKTLSRVPMVVLTNRGTADAAEIAAAALLDNKRADLVGERTYGDASIRRAITTDDGGAIILSVAKYYSPGGKSIQDSGVTPGTILAEPEPHVELDESGEPLHPDRDPTLPAAEEPRGPEQDVILNRAIEKLNK